MSDGSWYAMPEQKPRLIEEDEVAKFMASRAAFECERMSATITPAQCAANWGKCYSCNDCERNETGAQANDVSVQSKFKHRSRANGNEKREEEKKMAICKKCGEDHKIAGRGLCGKCYREESKAGTLERWPTKRYCLADGCLNDAVEGDRCAEHLPASPASPKVKKQEVSGAKAESLPVLEVEVEDDVPPATEDAATTVAVLIPEEAAAAPVKIDVVINADEGALAALKESAAALSANPLSFRFDAAATIEDLENMHMESLPHPQPRLVLVDDDEPIRQVTVRELLELIFAGEEHVIRDLEELARKNRRTLRQELIFRVDRELDNARWIKEQRQKIGARV